MLNENIKMAITGIKNSKTRSFFTMLGVIIGISSIIAIVSIGQGFKDQINKKIDDFGGNLATVYPGDIVSRDSEGNITDVNLLAAYGAAGLTNKDLKAIKDTKGVSFVAPTMVVSQSVGVTNGDVAKKGVGVIATNENFLQIINKQLLSGEFIAAGNEGSVVLGYDVAQEVFNNDAPLARSLKIKGESFAVKGVLNEIKSEGLSLGPSLNDSVFISVDSGKKLTNNVIQFQEINFLVDQDADYSQTIEGVNEGLLKLRSGELDYTVIQQDEVSQVTDKVFDLITRFIAIISSISLIVGTIGITNVMIASVSERRKEIGIKKSIGASNKHILSQFLTEAVVITLIGGLVGMAVAVIAGLVINSSTELNYAFVPWVYLASIILVLIVGVLAGLVPAFKAASKSPIDSLRSE